ncbi:MAG: hypothetical protein ACKO8Y_02000, partial [Actinomycetota bacterium]
HGLNLAKVVSGFGVSNEVVTSAKELKIALRRIYPGLQVIIAKMPDRKSNAEYLAKVLATYNESITL